jgi:acylphosphatase
VWFRDSTRGQAITTGVCGWVRNLPGGEVEAVFEGPRPAVDSMLAWARHGPERALVTSFEESTEEPEGLIGFEIRA